jgi:hypothetical protein
MNEPNEERVRLSAERIDILATMVQTLRAELAQVTAERDMLNKLISTLVEDAAGGEAFITVGDLSEAKPIDIIQDGEGRDDEITVRVVYP